MTRHTASLAVLLLFPFFLSSQNTPELMGITSMGGAFNTGTVYSLTPDGSDFKLRHVFAEVGPFSLYSGLTLASDGKLYGTTYDGGKVRSGTVFKMEVDGNNFEVIHSFMENDGEKPRSAPIEGSDGKLYGTTAFGGNNAFGVIYSLSKDGSDFNTLHHFTNAGGRLPIGQLHESPDGWLYGMTNTGGTHDDGTMYKIAKDGTGFISLHSFEGLSEGRYPFGGFVEDANGLLYGTLSTGGPALGGSIFSIKKDGSGFILLKSFDFSTDDGNMPYGTLLVATDGKLYGTAFSGGADFVGIIFSMEKNGDNYLILHEFTPSQGSGPYAGHNLLEGSDGFLYGTTLRGGNNNNGVVYKINKNGSGFSLLHEFDDDGKNPWSGLISTDGQLFGTTSSGGDSNGGVIFSIKEDGSGYTNIREFSKANDNGFFPSANLIKAGNGWVYGAAQEGGEYGFGLLFRLMSDGSSFETIYHFDGLSGAFPTSAMLEGSNGTIYGTAAEGGIFGNGTIFSIDPTTYAFSVLYTFSDVGEFGAIPRAGLIEGSNGKLYGAAQSGGSFGAGTIFRLNMDGSGLEALHHFESNGNTGRSPLYQLFENANEQLFGVTVFGGSTSINGDGTLFRINMDGSNFEVLKIFDNDENGTPAGPLVTFNDGYLYGTTSNGGANLVGTIYRISEDGLNFETIHQFDVVNGISPQGSLLPSPDDDWLYGVARGGGASDDGVVFRIKPDGSAFEKTFDFTGFSDSGSWPNGGLLWLTPVSASFDLPRLNGLAVVPNPSNGPVVFAWENGFPAENPAALSVADETGRFVFRAKGNLAHINHLLSSHSSSWDNGVYFLNLEMEGGYFREKVIVMKP